MCHFTLPSRASEAKSDAGGVDTNTPPAAGVDCVRSTKVALLGWVSHRSVPVSASIAAKRYIWPAYTTPSEIIGDEYMPRAWGGRSAPRSKRHAGSPVAILYARRTPSTG